jgi:hypothetical protein
MKPYSRKEAEEAVSEIGRFWGRRHFQRIEELSCRSELDTLWLQSALCLPPTHILKNPYVVFRSQLSHHLPGKLIPSSLIFVVHFTCSCPQSSFIFILFFAVPGLELRAYTLSHSTSPFCVRYFHELFA